MMFFSAPAWAYVGSAQISPQIAAAHVQIALDELAKMGIALRSGRGNAETPSLNLAPARQHLAEAADHLGLARMGTNDSDQQRTLDEILIDLEDLRERLDTHQSTLEGQLQRARSKALGLHAALRRQIGLLESRQ